MNKLVISILSFVLILFACQRHTNTHFPDEVAMEQLLIENPDSLAKILDNIHPDKFSDEEKANYGWWLTNVHVKQNRSLINDTLIHYAVDYYKRINSPRLLNSYLLAAEQVGFSGTTFSEQKRILNEAMQIACIKEDTAMVQIISSRLSRLYEYPQDIEKMRKLIGITKDYSQSKESTDTYLTLTSLFYRLNMPDSVSVYAEKGIDLARAENDNLHEYRLTRFYTENLNVLGRSKEALKILKDMESRIPVENGLKFDYISTWINMGNLDSALVYIQSFETILDEFKSRNGYNSEVGASEAVLGMFKTIIHIKEGKPLLNKDIGHVINKIAESGHTEIKNEYERRYIHNKLTQDNLILDIEHGKLRQQILLGGIVFLVVIVLLIFLYQRKLLKKERFIQQTREQLRFHAIELSENNSIIAKNEEIITDLSTQLDESGELKEEISLLVNENNILKQKNTILQKDIESHSTLMKLKDEELVSYENLVQQKKRLQERERFLVNQLIADTEVLRNLNEKPRYIEKSQWVEIIRAVDKLFDGFSYRLQRDYPSLTEDDVSYCCLFKLRLSTSIIGLLTGISPSSVTKRKQRIKEKMSQDNPHQIHKEQLLELYLWDY